MSEEKLIRILKSLPLFAQNFLIINNKLGQQTKFKFNRAQNFVDQRLENQLKETGKVRARILKGRQQGISTYVQARYFHKVRTKRGKRAFILTHLSDATIAIFGMTKRFADHLPESLFSKPDKNNDNTLMFGGIDSGYRVGTAGNENIGRSMTNQYLHLSEYPFYKKADAISLGLLQTVPELEGTEIIVEGTANGTNNSFYYEWLESEARTNRYMNIFVPWFWQDEYRIPGDIILDNEEEEWIDEFSRDGLTREHLNWRRIKIQDFKGSPHQKKKKFKQEYPMTPMEAFVSSVSNNFIEVDCVRKARKNRVESQSNLVIGIDPARSKDGEGDRTAIIRRRGRRAYGLETHFEYDSTRLITIITKIIEKENPSKVYVDAIGIGGPIVDRLRELGHYCVEGVIVSNSAFDDVRNANLRAELWGRMRDWLTQDMPVEIPDSDELQSDLTSILELEDARRRLLMESKKQMKARSLLSSDTADALMLTFFGGEYTEEGGYQVNRIPDHTAGLLI
jgi:hypothetical protein